MHKNSIVKIVVLMGLILLVYSNTFKAPFYFDDEQNITKNRHIRITTLRVDDLLKAGFRSYASNRPVANVSFAL
ncbi:MAG: hypothetical protein JRI36_14180, partial [Deltaproteobacteria bacterium]|nr:hypothetical protein [Deltaproteobacteria bacterium]